MPGKRRGPRRIVGTWADNAFLKSASDRTPNDNGQRSRGIQVTPQLNAEESRILLASLEGGATGAEMARRAARADERIAALGETKVKETPR